MLMRHFGHGVGHLQHERQDEIENESDDDDYDSDIVAQENAQEDHITVDIEEEREGESDRETDVDGYDSEAEMIGDSEPENGDSDDAGYTSF
jgi:hypothetical protein